MMRRPDWQRRFSDFGRARTGMPFAWGFNDCCTFAASSVQALTGSDPMASIPAYDCAEEAARLIAEGGGLRRLAESILGNSVSPTMAAVGDVVLLINAHREMLGVCNGTNVIAPGEHGMMVLGMEDAIAAWKI